MVTFFHQFKSPFVAALLILATIATFSSDSHAQDANAQLSKLYEGINLKVADSAFLSAPREVVRPLLRTRKMILAGDVKQAVDILGEILADEKQVDYLIPESIRSYSSLRRRTERILGWLGQENRQAYELRYGIRARKQLEKGLAENDMAVLKNVSARYFFTKAGVESTMVLGHLELSAGRPSAATSHFSKVLRYPELAADYEPEVSVLLATCHLLGDSRVAADRVLESLKARYPDATVTLMGETRSIFAAGADRIGWLTSLIGDSALSDDEVVSQWLMMSGNPARTGKVGHGLPLYVPIWKQRLAEPDWLQARMEEKLNSLVSKGTVPAPALQPLVVGDTVLQRGADRMYGVDIETGKRLWAYPPNLAWNANHEEGEGADAAYEKGVQRAFEDAVFGQAASDGRLIFTIPHPGAESDSYYNNPFRSSRSSKPLDYRVHNELVAIDCQKQGAVKWRVGGATGLDEPKLNKAVFLGEPLPFEGLLYCACYIDDVIKLVVLDSQTGALRWEMQLAAFNERKIKKLRRLAGITPAYANGKLFMMTGTSAVVAIDISTRSLLWGYVYKLGSSKDKVVSEESSDSDILRDAWRDAQVVIANGKVLLTPRESRDLICLDADTGLPAWFAEDGMRVIVKRSAKWDMHIAGIHRNQAILVGRNHVRGIDLENGRQTFEVDFFKYGVMSGRGYIGKGSLFLPTAKNYVIRIDLQTHEVSEAALTSIMLGNLVRFGKRVISHGADQISCFAELDATEKEIAATREGVLSPERAFVKAQTLIQRGEFEDGIALVADLSESNPSSAYADLLLGCAEHFLVDSPEKAFQAYQQLKRLYPDHPSKTFDRERAFTALRAGNLDQAVKWNLQMVREIINAPDSPEKDNDDQQREAATSETDVFISARMIDSLPLPNKKIEFEAEGFVESSNELTDQHTTIRFTREHWQQVQLVLASNILSQEDPEKANNLQRELNALVVENIDRITFLDRALSLIPISLLSSETLVRVAKVKMEKGQTLAALIFTKEALKKQQNNADLRLLKARVFLQGNDFAFAAETLSRLSREELSPEQQTVYDGIVQQLAKPGEATPSGWSDPSSVNWNSTVASNEKPKGKGRSVIDCAQVTHCDHPRYTKMKILFDPNSDNDEQLQITNTTGQVRQKLRVRKEFESSGEQSSQNWAMSFGNVGILRNEHDYYFLDWFRIFSGQNPTLWKMNTADIGSSRITFPESQNVFLFANGSLQCRDVLTGAVLWRRELKGQPLQITSAGDTIFVWLERFSTWARFDAETGRLVGQTQSIHAHPIGMRWGTTIVNRPLQKAGPEKQWLLEVLELASGKTLWSKVTSSQSCRDYSNSLMFVLEKDGQLEVVDFRTGKVLGESKIDLGPADLARLQSLRVYRHSAGFVLHVGIKSKYPSEFRRGQTTYEIQDAYGTEMSGPVILLDAETFEPKWNRPARLSRMAWLNSQPWNSPFLIFNQNVKRERPGDYKYFDSLVLIDARDGRLAMLSALEHSNWSSPLVKLSLTGDGTDVQQTMLLSNDTQQVEVNLVNRPLPPAPPVDLGNRGHIPFRDPLLPPPSGVLEDVNSDRFKNLAIEAAKKRDAQSQQQSGRLKEKMGVR